MEVEKLINVGKIWERFDSGAFTGLSAMDVAVEYGKKGVVGLLQCCRTMASAQGHWQRSGRLGWAWPSV
jgi:hypothetical protein